MLQAGDLGDSTFRGKIALENGKVTVIVERALERTDDLLIRGRRVRYVLEQLGNGLARDRHAFAMQQAVIQKHLHHLRNATSTVQVNGQIVARRLQIAQHRNALAHALEIVDRPEHARRMRDREKVQHGVGRSTNGHDHRDRVFNRVPGDDVPRTAIMANGVHQHTSRFCSVRNRCIVFVGQRA